MPLLNKSKGKVYPRVCGGTVRCGAAGAAYRGLSPRVRGNLAKEDIPGVNSRSIPACAGEPRRRATSCSNSGVYPRVCGGTHMLDCVA